ncbi:MAG: four helix bundle protein [Oscillospiraceae bacterium]|nr:four helix bundle protein [Oscillospiraceae bacterium]MBR6425093.1 four helix bundle protein [Oscillospiraceae bacterium]
MNPVRQIGESLVKRGPIAKLSLEFAVAISKLADRLSENRDYRFADQIGRSGASIGANIREADYAQSKADFISKLQIALKEAAETEFWLELLCRVGKISEEEYQNLNNTCGQIIAMLTASINTASKNIRK